MERNLYRQLIKSLPANPSLGYQVFACVSGSPVVVGVDSGKFGSGCAIYSGLRWVVSVVPIHGICQLRCKFTSSSGWVVTCDCCFRGMSTGVRRSAVCVSECIGAGGIGF